MLTSIIVLGRFSVSFRFENNYSSEAKKPAGGNRENHTKVFPSFGGERGSTHDNFLTFIRDRWVVPGLFGVKQKSFLDGYRMMFRTLV